MNVVDIIAELRMLGLVKGAKVDSYPPHKDRPEEPHAVYLRTEDKTFAILIYTMGARHGPT